MKVAGPLGMSGAYELQIPLYNEVGGAGSRCGADALTEARVVTQPLLCKTCPNG